MSVPVPKCPTGCGAANWELTTMTRAALRTRIVGTDKGPEVEDVGMPMVVSFTRAHCAVCGWEPELKSSLLRQLDALRLRVVRVPADVNAEILAVMGRD